jgi:hypothetical protein
MHFIPDGPSVTCYFGTTAIGILSYLCKMLFPLCTLRNFFLEKLMKIAALF